MPTIDEVIDDIVGRSTQASNRLGALADYLKLKFEEYGLPGVRGGTGGELRVRGLARVKDWDIAYNFAGKDRLLVSLKSVWKNAAGTVPNRIDDLMGEAANVQQMTPEIVIGYVLLLDAQADGLRKDGLLWSEHFEAAVKRIAIRKAPLWNQGPLEGTWFIKFDSQRPPGSRLIEPAKVAAEEHSFMLALLRELARREPAIPFTKPMPADG